MHREPRGEANDAMFAAILSAAAQTGIRLTYVPVLYERSGFEDSRLQGHQQQFALGAERFLEHHARACDHRSARTNVGIGAHSLRAVSDESLQTIAIAAANTSSPMHLHIAEQQREVDQCMAAKQRRPVRWLLENHDVDALWCGDGLFPLQGFLQAGGRMAIGSDSHVSINPFEELRWLEYGQRLAAQSRNITSLQQSHVGRELYSRALEGGAQAGGQSPVGLQEGAVADLVALYDEDPMLVGHDDDSLIDALVFSGYRLPIERVMVHGDWQVVDGDHFGRVDTHAGYAAALKRLGAI